MGRETKIIVGVIFIVIVLALIVWFFGARQRPSQPIQGGGREVREVPASRIPPPKKKPPVPLPPTPPPVLPGE